MQVRIITTNSNHFIQAKDREQAEKITKDVLDKLLEQGPVFTLDVNGDLHTAIVKASLVAVVIEN